MADNKGVTRLNRKLTELTFVEQNVKIWFGLYGVNQMNM